MPLPEFYKILLLHERQSVQYISRQILLFPWLLKQQQRLIIKVARLKRFGKFRKENDIGILAIFKFPSRLHEENENTSI